MYPTQRDIARDLPIAKAIVAFGKHIMAKRLSSGGTAYALCRGGIFGGGGGGVQWDWPTAKPATRPAMSVGQLASLEMRDRENATTPTSLLSTGTEFTILGFFPTGITFPYEGGEHWRISPDAFREVERAEVELQLEHDRTRVVADNFAFQNLSLTVGPDGIWLRAILNDANQLHRLALDRLYSAHYCGLSVGLIQKRHHHYAGVRMIDAADIGEISLVESGANPGAFALVLEQRVPPWMLQRVNQIDTAEQRLISASLRKLLNRREQLAL